MLYTFYELLSFNDKRDAVCSISAKTLKSAKIQATKRAMFKSTYLVLKDDKGNVVAKREPGGVWVNS